jgi:hypothetical protein
MHKGLTVQTLVAIILIQDGTGITLQGLRCIKLSLDTKLYIIKAWIQDGTGITVYTLVAIVLIQDGTGITLRGLRCRKLSLDKKLYIMASVLIQDGTLYMVKTWMQDGTRIIVHTQVAIVLIQDGTGITLLGWIKSCISWLASWSKMALCKWSRLECKMALVSQYTHWWLSSWFKMALVSHC